MINGEVIPFVEAISFRSKAELVLKLENMNCKLDCLLELDRLVVAEMIAACLQEISFCDELELVRLKKHLNNKKKGES